MPVTTTPQLPATLRVMVDKPFYVPVYEFDGDVPVKRGMRVTELDEVVTLDTSLALDAVAGGKARRVSLDPKEAEVQLAELAIRKKARKTAEAAAAAERERQAKLTPENQIAAAVALGVQMAIEKLGLGKATA